MVQCKICDESNSSAFRWSYALEESSAETANETASKLKIGWQFVNAIAMSVCFVRKLKFGELYECSKCGRNWYLFADFLHRLNKTQVEFILKWDAVNLVPSESFQAILSEIGGLESSRYGESSDDQQVSFPARVITISGEVIETAKILVTKWPPIDNVPDGVMLGADVREIQVSDYALPLDVRLAARNAREVRMGFSPTEIISPEGDCFLLNGAEMFFEEDGLLGKDIRLVGKGDGFHSEWKHGGINWDRVIKVYFDWFEGCNRLAIPNMSPPANGWIRHAFRRLLLKCKRNGG